MIDRYSLNPQPVDKIGENCERLPVGEVTYLQNMLNVNATDPDETGETYFDEDFHIEDLTIVGPEFFLSDWS